MDAVYPWNLESFARCFARKVHKVGERIPCRAADALGGRVRIRLEAAKGAIEMQIRAVEDTERGHVTSTSSAGPE